MPLVFLHGANVRRENKEEDFDRDVAKRDGFFKFNGLRSIVNDPNNLKIYNPYWGNLGAKFAWGFSSIPKHGEERFGPEEELSMLLLSDALAGMSSDSAIDPDNILTFAAHRSLSQAIDLLWASAADRLQAPNEVSSMATLAIQAADYAKSNPRPPWLKTVGNDREFVEALSEKVTSWQSVGNVSTTEAFGADSDWNPLIAARNRLGQLAQQVSLKNVFDFARRRAVESVGYLIGDIFFYLGQRGTKAEPGVIVKTVIAQLEEAKAAVIDKDKYLIVIAHSLGGEILYDILTYYRPDIQVDLFLTVGSQVGLFEELKLFHSSDPKIPNKAGDKAARPVNIRHWSNVYDLNDLLGFATSKIFTDVADYEFSTGAGLLFSHGSYFTTPSFHERLASRLSEIFR